MARPRYQLGDLTAAQTRAGMARFAPNWLPCQVVTYHAPEVIDGTPFPASVTVKVRLEYVRAVASPEDGGPPVRTAPTERKLTGEDAAAWSAGDTSARYVVIAGPYNDVRVPFVSPGSSELALISDPRPGDVGMLILAGRSIADALAVEGDGSPVLPEFMPNPLRLSDGMYLGCMLAGDAALPDEALPAEGTSQLGPRDARAASVYLRLTQDAWALAGTSIELGAGAVLGVARQTDPISIDAPSLAALNASLAAVFAPPVGALTGTITTGSALVKAAD